MNDLFFKNTGQLWLSVKLIEILEAQKFLESGNICRYLILGTSTIKVRSLFSKPGEWSAMKVSSDNMQKYWNGVLF